jgi:uncharacterized integral membrane protein
MSLTEQSTTADAPPKGDPAAPGAVAPAPPAAAPLETRRERFARKARRTRFHLSALLAVALLVCLVALVAANTRQVKLSWLFGSSTASLVWIVLASAVLGWLLGIVSSAVFHWRTRAPRA